jgi:hypothetical protein
MFRLFFFELRRYDIIDLYILIFLIGFTCGVVFTIIFKRIKEVHGMIDIDQSTGLCRFRITSDKLANNKKKYAIFKIDHNAEISRDERFL